MLIYTVVVPPASIFTELLLVANYTIVDVLVVHTEILYYTRNKEILCHSVPMGEHPPTCLEQWEAKESQCKKAWLSLKNVD